MAFRINFNENTEIKVDLDHDGQNDHATVVFDKKIKESQDQSQVTGKVYIALAKDGFSRQTLISLDFTAPLPSSSTLMTSGQKKLFSSCSDVDAANMISDLYVQYYVDKTLIQHLSGSEINSLKKQARKESPNLSGQFDFFIELKNGTVKESGISAETEEWSDPDRGKKLADDIDTFVRKLSFPDLVNNDEIIIRDYHFTLNPAAKK